MGKPYRNELNLLQHTLDWSQSVGIDQLIAHIKKSQGRPLFSVGSGGSLAAAHFQALLHQQSGAITRAVTPIELYGCMNTLCEAGVFFLSAGGSNPDVLSAYRQAALNEPRSLGGLCVSLDSPLKSLAEQFQFSKLIDFDLPAGKDGFLATNSLLALMVLLARALVKNPPLLILDEPCQGLDEEQSEYFKTVIDQLCSHFDTTLLYVSHYEKDIPACVSRYLKLAKGRQVN